jgi:hypothetical protein
MHFSPRPTLSINFKLGWTAKSLTPAGLVPAGAVSPLGLPRGFGTGGLIVERVVQSLVRVMEMVLSIEDERSFEWVGKWRLVRVDEWSRRVPRVRFEGVVELDEGGIVESP